jgi:hypothetical protein
VKAHRGILRYSSTHSLTSAVEGGEWSVSRSGRWSLHFLLNGFYPSICFDTVLDFGLLVSVAANSSRKHLAPLLTPETVFLLSYTVDVSFS